VLSNRHWKTEIVVAFLLGVLGCLLCGMLLTRLLFGPLPAGAVPGAARAAVGVLCFQLGTLFCAGWLLARHGTSWREAFGWANRRAQSLWLPVVTIALFLPVGALLKNGTSGLLKFLGRPDHEQNALLILQRSTTLPTLLLLGVLTVLLAPLVEELIFRGVLYPWLKGLGFPRLAWWGTATLFAAIHGNLPAFLPLVGLALLFVWLYEKTDNLLAPITAHLVFNAVNFVLFLLLRERAAPGLLPA